LYLEMTDATTPSCWLRWSRVNILSRLALNGAPGLRPPSC
jgi:hypothetical protein